MFPILFLIAIVHRLLFEDRFWIPPGRAILEHFVLLVNSKK